jgi:hypothetical protein
MSEIADVKVKILFFEPCTATNFEPEYQLRLMDGEEGFDSEIVLATGNTAGAAARKGKRALKRLLKELEKEMEDE